MSVLIQRPRFAMRWDWSLTSSRRMRLRELTAGGTPYRWFLEATTEHGWEVEHTMGLIFWNYFGRRSERIYFNDHLPARQL